MTLDLADRQLEDVVSQRAAARLRAFRRDAERLLPGRVTDVVLFGSRARGEARRDSDYDVAVFVEGLEDRQVIGRTLNDAAYPYVLAGYYISPIVLHADFLRERSHSLSFAIAREGVQVR